MHLCLDFFYFNMTDINRTFEHFYRSKVESKASDEILKKVFLQNFQLQNVHITFENQKEKMEETNCIVTFSIIDWLNMSGLSPIVWKVHPRPSVFDDKRHIYTTVFVILKLIHWIVPYWRQWCDVKSLLKRSYDQPSDFCRVIQLSKYTQRWLFEHYSIIEVCNLSNIYIVLFTSK